MNLLISAICGAICGGILGITLADIYSAAVDGYNQFDAWFSTYWRDILLIAAVPGAAIACAIFFLFLNGVGVLPLPAALGTALGGLFGFFVGPPESWVSGLPPTPVLAILFWEWFMGGVGFVIGWISDKVYERFY